MRFSISNSAQDLLSEVKGYIGEHCCRCGNNYHEVINCPFGQCRMDRFSSEDMAGIIKLSAAFFKDTVPMDNCTLPPEWNRAAALIKLIFNFNTRGVGLHNMFARDPLSYIPEIVQVGDSIVLEEKEVMSADNFDGENPQCCTVQVKKRTVLSVITEQEYSVVKSEFFEKCRETCSPEQFELYKELLIKTRKDVPGAEFFRYNDCDYQKDFYVKGYYSVSQKIVL